MCTIIHRFSSTKKHISQKLSAPVTENIIYFQRKRKKSVFGGKKRYLGVKINGFY